MFERSVHPFLYDSVLREAQREGVQPRSIHHVLTAEQSAQELFGKTSEVAFLTRAGAWRIARNGITMRPLRHLGLTLSCKLIARANDSSRIVSEFARALRRKLDSPRRDQLNLPLTKLNAL